MAAVTGAAAAFFYLGCRADKLFSPSPIAYCIPSFLQMAGQKGETGSQGIFVSFVTSSYSCHFLMSSQCTDRSFGGGINLSPSDQFICEPACVFHVIKP